MKKKVTYQRVPLTKAKRVAVLKRAREIISDPKRWTKGKLRRRISGEYRYCLLGACEQAVYDLGLADPDKTAFAEGGVWFDREAYDDLPLGYWIGHELSIEDFARENTGKYPEEVNDRGGREVAVQLIDEYLKQLKGRK